MIAALLSPAPALAQSSASDFTSAIRYDANRRVVGTIAPDPDGSGSLHHLAVRNTYDGNGRLTRVEKGELAAWQSEAVLPASWSGFTVFSQVDTTYDAAWRKVKDAVSSGGTTYAVTQYSYDAADRLDCTAVRMNPAVFGALPASACTAGTTGGNGPDRITKTIYDAAGQVLKVQQAYGTALQQDDASYSYTYNGKPATVTDAVGNRSSMTYDGFDRQVAWNFPSPTTAATVSATDYEAYDYDAGGNRTSVRKRDGRTLTYSYDALNRVTIKAVPDCPLPLTAACPLSAAQTREVYYGYDLRGLQTYARFDSTTGEGIATGYDGFGRPTGTTSTMGGVSRTLGYRYYPGLLPRYYLDWPDGLSYRFGYDGLDRNTFGIDAASGVVGYQTNFNAQGLPETDYRGNQGHTASSYDPIQRLITSSNAFYGSGGSNGQDIVTYNPASQVVSRQRTNDAYVWDGYVSVNRAYTANGLNQYSAVTPSGGGAIPFGYDANGNLTGDGTTSWTYDVENRLVAASNGTSLVYDPLGRLSAITKAGATTRFLYDGDQLTAEYDGSGNLLRRYVHGTGDDDPRVWWEGATMASLAMRFLWADRQGSVFAVSNTGGVPLALNAYDEYGIPKATNAGRFQYTGQAWLAELGMYYYKARMYSPTLGRFLQTDPIGYSDGLNIYAYVKNDPVNGRDPTGLACGSAQKRNGTCIDSNNYKASKDGNSTAQSNSDIDASARENMKNLESDNEKEEKYGAFDQKSDGSVTFSERQGNTKDRGSQLKGTFTIPKGTDAVGHSHPRTGDFTVTPGPGDHQIVEGGKPNYIIRDGVIIVVEKVSGQYQARVVQGSLDSGTRSAIRDVLNDFQRSTRR